MTVALKQLTIPEACELLRVSRSTIEREIRARRLKVVRIGRSVRVRESALAEFVARRER